MVYIMGPGKPVISRGELTPFIGVSYFTPVSHFVRPNIGHAPPTS